ncbi:hypothetical protein [Paenibacillus macquariensis]|uniref:Uncharacterized protein n=1 Tax=Paenibacillus macquariensis TaxID=948756 RepID=A0ABY1JKB3_9BACL|nr:hypothetical protein [Paenibacillus macquariensis]MEC0089888.1 hypothetical protein [Paenibacillus macquariensis]OAB30651.1 hypothetical protein PMSM_21100 [Paenibacillus macquariensis subsp. macquariensis]SIQ33659.1 hypothetical protein SAMN05421578_101273 [Paenibacillus macquariensis]
MALLKMPEKLLKVIWNGDFDTICVYEDGTWGIDVKKELISLSKSEITVSSKIEAMNHLMMLSTKLLEATTEEYAELAKKKYEASHDLWKESQLISKEFAEVKGKAFSETPFEYSPFPTSEEQFEEYYGQYFLDYLIDIQHQLTFEHKANFDFSIYVLGDASYGFGSADNYNMDAPYNAKIAFFVADDKWRPEYFIGENHPLFLKIKNEVKRVSKLAINEAIVSVSNDLHEWFRKQFGYSMM